MKGKVCVVTGASSGIGKVAACDLARRGAKVVAVCRDRGRGDAALEEIRAAGGRDASLLLCDFSSQRSIRALATEIKSACTRLDVLLNNAGAIQGERRVTEDGLETTFAVNHLGYFLLTELLLDLLRASAPARIVNVASAAHHRGHLDWEDLQSERGYNSIRAYGTSKLANISFTRELARRLEGTGVTVNSVHPGVVATNFGASGPAILRFAVKLGRPFLLDDKRGADTMIWLATSPDVQGVTGRYFIKRREARPSREASDPEVAARLWAVSEELTRA